MLPTEEQKKAYLSRIGYQGPIENTLACLKGIVEGHAFTFPYETLDIHDKFYDGKNMPRTNLAFNALFAKLVENNRGGHCVELNIPLQAMLRAFGFTVTSIEPRMLWHSRDLPAEKRAHHCAAIVTTENQEYLVDAAFGRLGIMSPLPLKEGTYQQYSEKFKLVSSSEYPFELQVNYKGVWLSIYGFDKKAVEQKTYEEIDKSVRDPLNKNSVFSDLFICAKTVKMDSTKNARFSIHNEILRGWKDGEKVVKEQIKTQQQFRHILKDYFDIKLERNHHIRFSTQEIKDNLAHHQKQPILHHYNTRYRAKVMQAMQSHQPLEIPSKAKPR